MHPIYAAVGPFYDATGAAAWLGIGDNALEVRRTQRTVLAVRTAAGKWLYPAWQINADGEVHRALVPVLTALRELDGWLVGIWLVRPHRDLDDLSPRQALATGTEADVVVRLAMNDAGPLTS